MPAIPESFIGRFVEIRSRTMIVDADGSRVSLAAHLWHVARAARGKMRFTCHTLQGSVTAFHRYSVELPPEAILRATPDARTTLEGYDVAGSVEFKVAIVIDPKDRRGAWTE